MAEEDENIKVIDCIKIGPANISDLAREGLEIFVDEKDIDNDKSNIESSDIDLRY